MKSKLFLLIFSILLISLVSSIYPGETQVYLNELGKTNLVWIIIENTSDLNIIPVVLVNTTNITITIPANMPPQSFKIIFLEETTNTIIQTVQVSSGNGGGHSHTITKYVNNTEYVNVPEYISVPNNTIEYVQNNTTQEKTVNVEEINLFMVILGLLLVGLIIGVLIYFMRKRNNQYNREGGKEENGEQRKEKFF